MDYNKRAVGTSYEEQAAAFLQSKGLTILEHNYRIRSGEIDLIAREGKYLVFIEVKYRKCPGSGSSLEAVTQHKQQRICRAARYYLLTRCHSFDIPCRFDVIGFDGEQIRWIQNAFNYQ